MEVLIREATLDDVRGLAKVDRASHIAAYAHLLPVSFDFTDSENLNRWQGIVAKDPGDTERVAEVVLVALSDGEVVGYIRVLRSRDEDGEGIGEVGALYVAPEHWRRGFGSLLIAAGTARLRDMGYNQATLWVLDENIQARSFYEKEGWNFDGTQKTVPRRGTPTTELRYRKNLA